MPRFAANLSMMFCEVPFLERFGAASQAGFEAVEFQFPYEFEPEAIARELRDHGLALALFNAVPGDWHAGERGLAALPGAGARFEAAFLRSLEYARVLKPGRVHVMAGIAQGTEARRTFVANLRSAAVEAALQGLVLTIEPLNCRDMPGYHLERLEDAARVIDAVGAENLLIQFDVYHAQITGGDITRRIEALAPVIGHVQIAGVPDRHEPDSGELSLGHVLAALDRAGCDGWIGCEYHPAGRTADGLGWLAPWAKSRD
jgi:hydroxypyruvate isomerase